MRLTGQLLYVEAHCAHEPAVFNDFHLSSVSLYNFLCKLACYVCYVREDHKLRPCVQRLYYKLSV
jgi:hypothetical protein